MSSDQANPNKIDVRNNAESRASAAQSTQRVARAGDGGAPPREAPRAGEQPEEPTAGTAVGSPVEGLEIDADDVAETKIPDESAMEVDGPTAGHA